MSDYLTSSNFGKFAGSILSRRREDFKSRFQKAIGIDFVKNFIDQAKTGLIQDQEDSINDILSNYDSVFKINEQEFNEFDRNKIDEYVKDKDTFLNKEAASKINNSNFAIENNVTWENRMNESEEIQRQLMNTFNSIRDDIDNEYKIKETNPKYTIKTLEQYNAPAKEELLAALQLVKNDPRQQTLFKKIWNDTFRRRKDPDGNLVSTNPEVIELEDNLMVAKVNRNTFRQRVEDADNVLEEYYQNLTGTDLESLNTIIKKQNKVFTEKELEDKTKNTINYFIDNKGKYTTFAKQPLIIDIEGEDKNKNKIINSIDIKQKIRNEQIKVLDENGELEPLSINMLYEAIALRRLYMAFEIEQKKENPLVGPTAIHAVIESFNKNGRFKVDGRDIIFTLPGTNIKNIPDANDIAALTQKNGKSKDEVPNDVLPPDEDQIQRYSVVNVLNFIEDLRLQGKSEEEINLAANNMKVNIFKNDKNISEEIDLIVNSTKKEFLKLKKLELEQFAKSSFLRRQFPEDMFKNEFGSTSDIDKLLGE